MKRIIIVVVLLGFINILNAKVYESAIKQKVKHYLAKQNIVVNVNEIKIKNNLPDYKLYDIKIKDFTVRNNKISVNVIIADFFHKSVYTNIECIVDKQNQIEKYRTNSKVKLIYKVNNIEIKDIGKIIRKEDNYYFIKNSFGKIIRCVHLKKNIFKVLE